MTPQRRHPWIKRIRTQQHPLPDSEAKILRHCHHRVTSFVLASNLHRHIRHHQHQLYSRIVTSLVQANNQPKPTRNQAQPQRLIRARGVRRPVIHELGRRYQPLYQRPRPDQKAHGVKALPAWTRWINTVTDLRRPPRWGESAVGACPRIILRGRWAVPIQRSLSG